MPSTQVTKAISYLRYSTKKQASGGSVKRQIQATLEYCERHNYELLDTYKDLGVSAHRGKHSKEGNLAKLLADCASGAIPKGIALIIENFDRLSREEVPIALQRFLTLINDYGIEIHTLDDGRVYTPGKVELTELIISIVVMGRAHEESQRKSYFVSKAWEQVRERGKASSRPNFRPLGRHPSWLDWDSQKQQWILVEKKVATILSIYRMLIDEGLGSLAIARRLNTQGVQPFASRTKLWNSGIVRRLIQSESLVGILNPTATKDKTANPIESYYPAIVDKDTWKKAMNLIKSRTVAGGRSDLAVNGNQYAILTGITFYKNARCQKSSYTSGGKISPRVKRVIYIADIGHKRYNVGLADHLEHFVCKLIKELDQKDLECRNNEEELGYVESQVVKYKSLVKSINQEKQNLTQAILIAPNVDLLATKLAEKQKKLDEYLMILDDLEVSQAALKQNKDIYNRVEVVKLLDKALVDKNNNAREKLQATLGRLIRRIDLARDLEDLPVKSQDFINCALLLQVDTPIKYWARIELFNDAVVLGAMTPDGKIARIRWEESE